MWAMIYENSVIISEFIENVLLIFWQLIQVYS